MVLLSVIIPTRDHYRDLKDTIDSFIIDQTFQKINYEFVIANDGANKDIEKLIIQYKNQKINIKSVIIKKSKGSYFARNRAAEIAKGEHLFFFDSGMTISNNWFIHLKPLLSKYDYIGGDVKIKKHTNMSIGEKFDSVRAFPMRYFLKKNHYSGAGYLIVKKEIFIDLGGFNSTLYSGGDVEFGMRVYKKGITQYFFDKAPAYHPPRTFKEQYNKLKRTIKGHYDIYCLYPNIAKNPVEISYFKLIIGFFSGLLRRDILQYKKNIYYNSKDINWYEYIIGVVCIRFVNLSARIYVKKHYNDIINT